MTEPNTMITRDGLIRDNPVTGVRTQVKWLADGKFLIHEVQDERPALRMVEEMRATQDMRADYHHLAEIPVVLYHQWVLELGRPDDNPDAWVARLQSSEFHKLRVRGG